ncbi:Cell division cycle protein 20 -like protein p55CDC [Takifugu flavidus]|uniref:Cell division cycle protein 20-like protein p55CDC n=1 Tax=Takifugu flavidus TaxID=433684 RepID=A0A5C6P178_9TELE|nr:Cell division cycle protein 20 -like protein p55CDC [Takifugu flavidus]
MAKKGQLVELVRIERPVSRQICQLVPAGLKTDSFPVRVGLHQGCPLSPVLFITFMDRISRRSRGVKGVEFCGRKISSLLFADDVVLLAPSSRDLQHILGQFMTECEAAGMWISTSKSESMVLTRKKVECLLRVGEESCPRWRSSSITSEDTAIVQMQTWGVVGAQQLKGHVLLNGVSLPPTNQEVAGIIKSMSVDEHLLNVIGINLALVLSKSKKQTPCKMGGDRFIPVRNNKQMDVASFLLTKENEPVEAKNNTALSSETQKAWSISLNGYNIEDAKILHLGGRPLNAPEDTAIVQMQTWGVIGAEQLKGHVLLNGVSLPPTNQEVDDIIKSILKALAIMAQFGFENDIHSILKLDMPITNGPMARWQRKASSSSSSALSGLSPSKSANVSLGSSKTPSKTPGKSKKQTPCKMGGDRFIPVRNNKQMDVASFLLTKENEPVEAKNNTALSSLWDVENQKRVRSMASHTARVGSLSWNDHILSSGSRSGHIHHHDVRVAEHHICTLTGHSQEVCGLQWSPDGRYLASGGNDNLVCVWPRVQDGGLGNRSQAIHKWSDHQGAVKALAWCPWQPNILASGGGTSDRHIRVWNVNSGSCISSLDTQSQVSSLVFAPNYKELVSAHGYAHNNVVIWKYPSLTKVVELHGHDDRVFNVTLSPDASTIATISGDEIICLWKSFEMDPVKKAKEKMRLIPSEKHGPQITSLAASLRE